jgi:hypothetical protein
MNVMNFRIPVLIATAVLSLAPLQAMADESLSLSNKWRVEVSEGANSDGNIVFRVTPDQGAPTDVTVAIKDGRSENNVARDIAAGLKAGLDKKVYKVERDDGEDVLVKKRKGPNFELKLVESTVKSVRINVAKE